MVNNMHREYRKNKKPEKTNRVQSVILCASEILIELRSTTVETNRVTELIQERK